MNVIIVSTIALFVVVAAQPLPSAQVSGGQPPNAQVGGGQLPNAQVNGGQVPSVQVTGAPQLPGVSTPPCVQLTNQQVACVVVLGLQLANIQLPGGAVACSVALPSVSTVLSGVLNGITSPQQYCQGTVLTGLVPAGLLSSLPIIPNI
jgi:hypothetical protein